MLGVTQKRDALGAGGGGVSATDEDAFVTGTDQFTPVGGIYDEAASDNLAEDEAGVVRLAINRAMHVVIRDGAANERSLDVDAEGNVTTRLLRTHATDGVTIANGANLSEEIDFTRYSGANLHMPAVWTAADIGFHVSTTTGGTFLPFYDDTNTLVQISGPAISRAYTIPAEIFACGFIKLWSQNAGVNANQGGDRAIIVEMKG